MKKNIIKYSILTPSKMEIIFNEKRLIVTGEVTTAPVFYADIKSIKYWEDSSKIEVTEEEKKEIIMKISEDSNQEGFVKVIFD